MQLMRGMCMDVLQVLRLPRDYVSHSSALSAFHRLRLTMYAPPLQSPQGAAAEAPPPADAQPGILQTANNGEGAVINGGIQPVQLQGAQHKAGGNKNKRRKKPGSHAKSATQVLCLTGFCCMGCASQADGVADALHDRLAAS